MNRQNTTYFRVSEAVDVLSEISSSTSTDIYLANEIYLASNPYLIFTRSAKGPMFDLSSNNVPPYCDEPPACNMLLIQFLRMMVDQLMVTVVASAALVIEMNFPPNVVTVVIVAAV